METTPITVNTNSNGIWKWLTGLSLAGIAGFLGWKYLLKGQLPNPVDEESSNDVNINSNSEKYGVQVHKFQMLNYSKWAESIVEQAKQKGMKFENHLNDLAVGKYVREGLPDQKVIDRFEQKILEYQIKARQSEKWMESISKKAKVNNISFEKQLRNSAIWMVLQTLVNKYKDTPNQDDNSSAEQQSDQDTFNGFAISN